MKVRTKLYLSCIISIVLVGMLVFAVYFASDKVTEANKELKLAIEIETAVSELDMIAYEYLLHHEERMERQWNLRYASMSEVLDRAESGKIELTGLIEDDYKDINDLFLQVAASYEKRQKFIREDDSEREIDAIVLLEERLASQLLIKSQSIISNAFIFTEQAYAEAAEVQEIAQNLILVLVTVLIILIAITSFAVARGVSRPLDKLTEGSRIIGEGGLDHRIDIKSKDELGRLAVAFNWMTANLQDSLNKLKEEVAERKKAEKEVVKINRELEDRVVQRTSQLQASKEEMERERDKIRTIMESIGDGVVAIDRSWNIFLWNKAATEISGWTGKEAMGKPLTDILKFIREKDRKENIGFIEDAFVRGETRFMENHTVLARKDGSEVPVGDSAAPIRDSRGSVVGVIITFRDVSKERDVQRLRSDFAYASHQIRTPITKALWSVELALDEEDRPEVHGKIKDAYMSLQSIASFAQKIIIVSDIDQGRVFPEIKETDARTVLEKTAENFRKDAEGLGVDIEVKSFPDPILIETDPAMLKTILSEIIDNAVKYSDNSGTVSIQASDMNDALLIKVADFGLGIREEEQAFVFTKFFRGSNIDATKIPGSGLGLYIAREYANLLKGKIWFESKPDEGSVFYISLPKNPQ